MAKAEKWIWLDEERYPEYQTTIYTSIEKKEEGNYNVAEFVKEYFFDCEVAEAEPLPSIIRMVLQYLFQMIGSISPDRKYIQERLNTFFGYESKLHYTLFRVNVWTAKPLVEKYGEDKVIVTILTDRAERNFSIALHKEDYKNGFY